MHLVFKTSIAGIKTRLLIDNGSEAELIDESFVRKHKLNTFKLDKKVKLTLWRDSTAPLEGRLDRRENRRPRRASLMLFGKTRSVCSHFRGWMVANAQPNDQLERENDEVQLIRFSCKRMSYTRDDLHRIRCGRQG